MRLVVLKQGRIMLQNVIKNPDKFHDVAAWNILLRENKDKCGEIILHSSPTDESEVEVDIELEDIYQGQGYGVEAMELVCKWAFVHEKIHTVLAITEMKNVFCQEMLEKAGFKQIEEENGQQVWEREKKENYLVIYIGAGIVLGLAAFAILSHRSLPGVAIMIVLGALLGYYKRK